MSDRPEQTEDSESTDPQDQAGQDAAGAAVGRRATEVAAQGHEGTEGPPLSRVLEALLFSCDRPVSARRLADLVGAGDGRQVRKALQELQGEYESQGRAFAVEEIAGGFQLLTRPEFAPYVARLHSRQQQDSLSKPALETLAIVAYRQPITRAEVEDIRGVGAGHILRSLVEKRLLKVVGKSEGLGRALLYGTTRRFLQVFGLRSLKDLPRTKDLVSPRRPEGDAGDE